MAAAAGIRSYSLFGTNPVFDHSRDIVPIASPGDGPDYAMARIDVALVVGTIRGDRAELGPGITPPAA
jgi:hypothetical protein